MNVNVQQMNRENDFPVQTTVVSMMMYDKDDVLWLTWDMCG